MSDGLTPFACQAIAYLAGPRRMWRFHNDPSHEWMLKPTA